MLGILRRLLSRFGATPPVQEGQTYCVDAFNSKTVEVDGFNALLVSDTDACDDVPFALSAFSNDVVEVDAFDGKTTTMTATNENCGD